MLLPQEYLDLIDCNSYFWDVRCCTTDEYICIYIPAMYSAAADLCIATMLLLLLPFDIVCQNAKFVAVVNCS